MTAFESGCYRSRTIFPGWLFCRTNCGITAMRTNIASLESSNLTVRITDRADNITLQIQLQNSAKPFMQFSLTFREFIPNFTQAIF